MFGPKRNPAITYIKQAAAALDLTGQKVCVVGGTDGIGRAVARLAAGRGAEVTVVGRTFRDAGAERISFMPCDMSLMKAALHTGGQLPPDTNVLLFTNGIVAKPTRQETPEGLEQDMAVSYLSRMAMMRSFMPRVQAAAAGKAPPALRVFVMGFPGAGQAGVLGDLNAEKSYSAMTVHMNTVAGNEALVLNGDKVWGKEAEGGWLADVFGLNPGLIKTGIRRNLLGTGFLSGVLEWVIGMTCQSAERYAERIVPLMFASELTGKGGAMFDNSGNACLPTPALTKPEHLAALVRESEALLERALAHQEAK